MTRKPDTVPPIGAPEVKTALRAWYDRNGVHPAEGRRRLEALTGVPMRTLERAEQTGVFPYPRLLVAVLEVL